METTLTIKPSGKSNFLKAIRPKLFTEVMVNGERRLTSDGEFQGERIDGVRGTKRIKWDGTKYPTGTLTKDELNALVASCKFINDKVGHPDRGKLILTADPQDFDDPFFSHRDCEIRLEEYTGTLTSERPLHRIFMEYVRAFPTDFSTSKSPAGNRSAKLKVIDVGSEASDIKKSVDTSKKAVELYLSLNADKRSKIALALRAIRTEKTDMDLIEAALWKICTGIDEQSEQKRLDFISLATLPTERFNNRYLIVKTQSRGKLKELPRQGWVLNGVPIGLRIEDVNKYFDDPNNAQIIADLEKTILG